MIPRPPIIPKMDRKWSPTANDPRSEAQMIPMQNGTGMKSGHRIVVQSNFITISKTINLLRSYFTYDLKKLNPALKNTDSKLWRNKMQYKDIIIRLCLSTRSFQQL